MIGKRRIRVGHYYGPAVLVTRGGTETAVRADLTAFQLVRGDDEGPPGERRDEWSGTLTSDHDLINLVDEPLALQLPSGFNGTARITRYDQQPDRPSVAMLTGLGPCPF
jgi:hypothetical protein